MSTKKISSENEIINDLTNYINSKKRNRYSALSPLKREARTKRVCDFVFEHPNIFKLSTEIKFVPMDVLSKEMLIKLILADPENISLLDDDLITTEVMVAFEFSKRRIEHMSAREWHDYGLKLNYPNKINEVRDDISDLCDKLDIKFNDRISLNYYNEYVNTVCECILAFFQNKDDIVLNTVDKVVCKYHNVDINTDKPTLILIAGNPDSGKTTFGRMLQCHINNSICLDSDELAKRGMELAGLDTLVPKDTKVVIFSDPNADHYFSEKSMEKYNVVNIVIVPSSLEKMYRHSKHKQVFPYEEFAAIESRKIAYEGHYRDITVINDYDERLWSYVDNALEDMSILLDFELKSDEEQKKLKVSQ